MSGWETRNRQVLKASGLSDGWVLAWVYTPKGSKYPVFKGTGHKNTLWDTNPGSVIALRLRAGFELPVNTFQGKSVAGRAHWSSRPLNQGM